MISCSVLLLALLASTDLQLTPPLQVHTARIRGLDEHAAKLLVEGRARSLTFRSIVDRLEHDSVIVLVSSSSKLPHAGEMVFLAKAGGVRYVRIMVRVPGVRENPISWLAHELRHAVEIADAKEVVDQASLKEYAQRTGMISHTAGEFESIEAQKTGEKVRDELLEDPPPPEEALQKPVHDHGLAREARSGVPTKRRAG